MTAAVLAVAMAVFIQPSVQAITLYHVRGTVTDPLGRPLEDVRVNDGFEDTYTATDGTYSLPQDSTGTFTLDANRRDLESGAETVTVLVPVDTTVDFTLRYVTQGILSRAYLSTALGPATSTLTITSWAPVEGSCVSVYDPRTNTITEASLVGVNADGSSSWLWDLSVPQGSGEAWHTLSFWADDCASGTRLSWAGTTSYLIDNTSPVIEGAGPEGWAGRDALITARLSDAGGAGVDRESLVVEVDGVGLVASWNSSTRLLSAQASGLSPGVHEARVTAKDHAGNAGPVLVWSFTVDDTAPAFGAPSPTGVIADRTPLLAVVASESGSGLDASSASMWLSDGVLTERLQPDVDPSTGEVSYQVPERPRDVRLGGFPLPDGDYRVVVEIADTVGNRAEATWTFTVATIAAPRFDHDRAA